MLKPIDDQIEWLLTLSFDEGLEFLNDRRRWRNWVSLTIRERPKYAVRKSRHSTPIALTATTNRKDSRSARFNLPVKRQIHCTSPKSEEALFYPAGPNPRLIRPEIEELPPFPLKSPAESTL